MQNTYTFSVFFSLIFIIALPQYLFGQEFPPEPQNIPIEPSPDSCDCLSFGLTQNQTYILSGWVKEDIADQLVSYTNPQIEINFYKNDFELVAARTFKVSGPIIDGWQQITGRFTVPQNYNSFDFILRSIDSNVPVFFDDIRIHPFYSNMKSFVYDTKTLRLMAELDENNYASFYEYDKEGGLVRVKKETEKGVYTIQETRSKTVKTQ